MKDTNFFAKNLIALLKKNNLSQKEVAGAIGVSPQSFNSWVRGAAYPRMDKISALAEYFNIGESELLGFADELSSVSSKAVRIFVFGSVPAGVPTEAIEDIVDFEDIPREWTDGGVEYFGLKVKGDSMFPKYLENDTVIIRKQDDCESGQDCVVYVNGYDATLKKVIKKQDCIILQPLNSAYDPKIYDYNDEENPVKIAGVVVEIRRKV